MFTGPPLNKEDDINVVHELMKSQATKIVCGGTTANIVARVLNKKIDVSLEYTDTTLPPMGRISGIDLVTEGVLTLSRAVALLKQYEEGNVDEQCTDLTLLVGKAINEAHQNPGLPFDLSIRMNLMEQIKDVVEKMGKNVEIKYY